MFNFSGSRGSALEVETQLELASMFGFGEATEMMQAKAITSEEIKILNSVLATLREKVDAKKDR
jgi:hypothetical protein